MTKSGSEHHQELINPWLDRLTQIWVIGYWWNYHQAQAIIKWLVIAHIFPVSVFDCSVANLLGLHP